MKKSLRLFAAMSKNHTGALTVGPFRILHVSPPFRPTVPYPDPIFSTVAIEVRASNKSVFSAEALDIDIANQRYLKTVSLVEVGRMISGKMVQAPEKF